MSTPQHVSCASTGQSVLMQGATCNATVIIVSWNSAPWLDGCIRQLLAQNCKPAAIKVVDNASTDNSVAVIKRFPEVELIEAGSNLGFAAGNNLALAACDTEFVVLLNPDAFAEPDWLGNLVLAAQTYPLSAAIGSRQLNQADASIIDGVGDVYHVSGMVWRAGYGTAQQASDFQARPIFAPCAAAALYRRKALLEIGGFDEDYFCYVEDVDLGFRLRLAGYDAMYAPDAIVHHVGSATTGSKHSDFSVYHGHRNLVWTFVKNMPGPLFWMLLPFHLVLNIVTLLHFSMQGQAKVIFRAKVDALKGLPVAWRKRKMIQKARVASLGSIWQSLEKGNFFRRGRPG
jgi:GT2 family glycosyltransferase